MRSSRLNRVILIIAAVLLPVLLSMVTFVITAVADRQLPGIAPVPRQESTSPGDDGDRATPEPSASAGEDHGGTDGTASPTSDDHGGSSGSGDHAGTTSTPTPDDHGSSSSGGSGSSGSGSSGSGSGGGGGDDQHHGGGDD
jgi:hypothetical protein